MLLPLCLAVAAAGAVVPLISPDTESILLTAILVASVTPVAIRFARGTLDIFEPIVFATAAFLLLFFARPLYDVLTGTHLVYAVIDRASFEAALMAALVAIVTFHIGYHIPAGRRIAERLPPVPDVNSDTALAVAFGLVAASVLLLAARTTGLASPFLLASFEVAVPAFLVCWLIEGRARILSRVLSAIPATLLLATSIAGGERLNLLPAVVAVLVLLYLRRDRRPSAVVILLSTVAVFLFVVSPVRESRDSELSYIAAVQQSLLHPAGAVEDLLMTGDTEMIDTFAFQIGLVGGGGEIPWQRGMATLAETVLQPIPQQLWPGKPETIRNQIITRTWGMRDGQCISMCPTFSVLSTFHADAGLPGVAAGSFAIGVIFRGLYAYLLSSRSKPMAQVAYATIAFMPFFIWWSSLGALVVRSATGMLPVLLLAFLARRGANDGPQPRR